MDALIAFAGRIFPVYIFNPLFEVQAFRRMPGETVEDGRERLGVHRPRGLGSTGLERLGRGQRRL